MRPSPSSQAGRFSSAPSTPLPRSGFVQSAALGAQLTAAVLEVSDELFLLRVDRDRRLAGGLPGLHPRVDVFELGVAVGVACALAGLAVGLQAEAEPAQQSTDQRLAGGEAALGQRASEVALALADPQQGGLGIAADGADCTSSLRASSRPGCVSARWCRTPWRRLPNCRWWRWP